MFPLHHSSLTSLHSRLKRLSGRSAFWPRRPNKTSPSRNGSACARTTRLATTLRGGTGAAQRLDCRLALQTLMRDNNPVNLSRPSPSKAPARIAFISSTDCLPDSPGSSAINAVSSSSSSFETSALSNAFSTG